MPPKAKGAAKKKNGYQMPEKFEDGYVLKDIFKTNWTLGKPIGQGGFGLIYLANKGDAKIKNPDQAEYVVKIEPKDNGPLFCETHFYINCAKDEDIKTFIKSNGLKHLAMPKYISSGLCTYNGKDYRFLVMDRYVKDLQSVLNQSTTHQINEIGVMCLMRQILYCLEYIHQKGYTHGDIKGANLMLKSDNEAYLVDYGLACRFKRDNNHAKYEIKPERKHNGTIEYTSRDAHCGAAVYRRSDLEILGYCIIHWLSGNLPWMGILQNCEQVQQSKIKNMNNSKEFARTSLANCSDQVRSFMEYYLSEVNKLEFDSEPAYSKIYAKIHETLRNIGYKDNIDNFSIFKPSTSIPKTPKASNLKSIDDENEKSAKKRVRSSKKNSEEDAEIVEEVKKPNTKLKTASEATPGKNTPSKASSKKASYNEFLDELSDIEEDTTKAKSKSSKKSRNNLQSTAIDQTNIEHFKDKLKEIVEEDTKSKNIVNAKKLNPVQIAQNELTNGKNVRNEVVIGHVAIPSPRINKLKENSDSITPKRSTRNNSKLNYKEDDDYEEYDKKPQQTGSSYSSTKQPSEYLAKDLINTPNKYDLRTITPSKQTPVIKSPVQVDPQINKIKQHQSTINAPRSPLALSNMDKKSGVVLVKKRKNVPKSTISTQTDESYLMNHQPFFKY